MIRASRAYCATVALKLVILGTELDKFTASGEQRQNGHWTGAKLRQSSQKISEKQTENVYAVKYDPGSPKSRE